MPKVFYESNRKQQPEYKYSVKDIATWHEKTFDLATLQEQKHKFEEELSEWNESHDMSELADMYIVAAGMTRYQSADAMIAFHKINEECLLNHIMSKDLLDAVDKKMAINQTRTWQRVHNVGYKHVSIIKGL